MSKIMKIIFIVLIYISLFSCLCQSSVDEFYKNVKVSKTLNYDFVIVGAGSAGSIVANKLSANKLNRVLLIEEGGYSTNIYKVMDQLKYSNDFITFPDYEITKYFENALFNSTGNRFIKSLRGKVAGGSNSINGMVAAVGNSEDYDKWANITGEKAWLWNNTVHKTHLPDLFSHIPLRVNGEDLAFNKELKKSIQDIGYSFNENPFNGSTRGFIPTVSTQRQDEDGLYHRVTSFSQYVSPISKIRHNLSIMVKHKAMRIDIDSSAKPARANGLFLKDLITNRFVYVRIGKELILSAGAYDSPLLLQISGVGDSKHLSKLGIKTTIESPFVGKHLVDHVALVALTNTLKASIHDRNIRVDSTPYNGYRIFGPNGQKDVKWINTISFVNIPLMPRLMCSIEMVGTTTVGYLEIEKIRSDNQSYEKPLLRLDNLADPAEMENMLEGLESCRKVESKLIEVGILNSFQLFNGPINTNESNIDTQKLAIRNNVFTAYHPHGTLRMGPENDISFPTTGRLKLKGSANIRVVDASVIPSSPAGNTNLPTMIVGLQGSQFILSDNPITLPKPKPTPPHTTTTTTTK